MEHKTYVKLIPESDTAVLFIHGIVGTPNHFKDLIPLVPAHWSVYNILLDGHGKGVRDFAKTSMKKWKAQAEDAVEELAKTHKNIFIVAHSMGTLFAIEASIRHPDVVKGLFLLAVPLKISLKPSMFIDCAKVYFNAIRPTDKKALAAKAAFSIQNDWRVWRYIGWLPRYFELFALIRRTRRKVPQVSVPCRTFPSRKDEMVSFPAARKLLRGNPYIHMQILPNSRHFYYDEADHACILAAFKEAIEQNFGFTEKQDKENQT